MSNLNQLRPLLNHIYTTANKSELLDSLLDILQITKYYDNENSKLLSDLITKIIIQYDIKLNNYQTFKIIDYYISTKDIISAVKYFDTLIEIKNIDEKCEKNRLNYLISIALNKQVSEEEIDNFIIDYENSNKKPLFTSIYYELYRHNLYNTYKSMLYYKQETSEESNNEFRSALCISILPINITEVNCRVAQKKLDELENALDIFLRNGSLNNYAFLLCKICLYYIDINDFIKVKIIYNRAVNFLNLVKTDAYKYRLLEVEAILLFNFKEYKSALEKFKLIAARKVMLTMPFHLAAIYYYIGASNLYLGNQYGAKYYLFKTLIYAQQNKYDNILLLTIKQICTYYKSIENYKLALSFSEYYNTTKNDIEKNGKLQYFKKIDLLNKYKRETKLKSDNKDFISRLFREIDYNLLNDQLSVPYLCRKLGLSKMTLGRKLKLAKLESIGKIILQRRLAYADNLLTTQKDMQVKEIAYLSGFNSVEVFSRTYKKYYNKSPSVTKSQ